MLVLLGPTETIGWSKVLRTNGIAKAREYGRFLGDRYKRYTDIIWMHGNDLQSWEIMTDDGLVHAVASGIRSAAPHHLHTLELNYRVSAFPDNAAWNLSINSTRPTPTTPHMP
jgi:Protein of unknown function (DUF4038)